MSPALLETLVSVCHDALNMCVSLHDALCALACCAPHAYLPSPPRPLLPPLQVDDLALKQMALERVVRASDVNESRCEMAVWRLQDKSNEAKKLAADNQQLR